ncbi:tbc domain containing protein [Cystoisospora suis]|uniref:Tbc domain containing protein n=1 Tax=Cystoisospora suis TaxID=483139 RepID=A0A2C6JL16_9APIC|nr:tbc domain containing protein [Cystoisospora suis]
MSCMWEARAVVLPAQSQSQYMMIGSEQFWKTEVDAPLLKRNAHFLRKDNAKELLERGKCLVDLVQDAVGGDLAVQLVPDCKDEAARRIFILDAERTFKSPEHRQQMVTVLQSLWPELQDYHQGLGFLVAFLLLYLSPEDVVKVAIALHRHYVPGYFKAAPAAYVRDAKVYQKLLQKFFPDVATRIGDLTCPEAYVSKWFIGMNVHVLTYEAMMLFLEAFFERKDTFLFQYALALVKNVEADIMATKDVSKILAIMRLDESVYPDAKKGAGSDEPGSFFVNIVEDAINFDLGDADLQKLRDEATEEMRVEEEKRKEREKQMALDSDDEIVFSDEDD